MRRSWLGGPGAALLTAQGCWSRLQFDLGRQSVAAFICVCGRCPDHQGVVTRGLVPNIYARTAQPTCGFRLSRARLGMATNVDSATLRCLRSMVDRGSGSAKYGLHGIWLRWHSGFVDVDFPAEFGVWLDRLEATAREGDDHARAMLVFVVRALNHLRGLAEAPMRDEETAGLRWVRQSRRYELWRCLTPTTPEWPYG